MTGKGRMWASTAAVLLLLAGVGWRSGEPAASQTAATQTVPAQSTAVVSEAGGAVTIINQTPQPISATLDGLVLTLVAAPNAALIVTPICTHPDGENNALRCVFGAPPVPADSVDVGDGNAPPSLTPTPPPQPSCPASGACTVTLYTGQTIAIGSFSVANQGWPFQPGKGSSMVVSFDGTTLVLTGVDDSSARAAGCTSVNGIRDEFQCPSPQGALSFFALLPNPAGADCEGVNVPAGWNLLSGVEAQSVNLNVGPIYTYRAGESDYEALQPDLNLSHAGGYWVYFAKPTQVSRGCVLPVALPGQASLSQPVVISAGAGLTMIGNPFNFAPAAVDGADAVYTYDPVAGYQELATLQTGQGAWVYSEAGGPITLTPTTAAPLSPPATPPLIFPPGTYPPICAGNVPCNPSITPTPPGPAPIPVWGPANVPPPPATASTS